LNHKQNLLLDIKCYENYTIFIFKFFNKVFEKWKIEMFSTYKHND
jgi:hypothetical protein